MIYDFDTPVDRRGTGCEKWDELAEVFGKGDLLPFWVADMDFRSAPEIIEELRRLVDFGVFGYPTVTDGARESVAGWLEKRHGWTTDPSRVGFTPGIITALSAAVQAFSEPGDGVVIQTPVYPQFFSLIRRNDRVVLPNPLIETEAGYEMDFDNLREVLQDKRAKILLLCSPHNPVARVWKAEELSRLSEICLERGVTVLSDEIHQDLIFSDAKHLPIGLASPQLDPLLITFVAPSKTFNIAGLSASAWIANDQKIAGRMKKTLSAMHVSSANMLGLAALEAAYRNGEPWLNQLMQYLEGSRGLVESFIKNRMPRVRMKHPEGTFIFWLDFRAYGLGNRELQRILINDAGVALSPGANFGGEGEGFARLNVGCPKAQLEEGLSRIERAFANL
ncbi:MAG: PatB family C-S lyase [Synergistaceae bacterium]|jgi:cystathionine beta-lyase|nr:PatB family C-S lyase [Synergistaceae bacterium]